MRPLRLRALGALERARLLRPTYRAYEAVVSRRTGSDDGGLAADGLPLPPPHLRTLVAGTADAAWFLTSGGASAAMVGDAAERHGKPVGAGTAVLDFGCGCGRVARHWSSAAAGGAQLHGSDYNARAVRWCAEHLPFGRFEANGLDPPLAWEDERFDLVYAVSVFTHLPEEAGRAWLEELRRVLRPGGLLLLTTHGDRYLDVLVEEERERFLAGEVVVRRRRVAGTNLCAAYHPSSAVRERLARGFELLEHVPEGAAAGSPHQDLVVLRK